MYEAPESDDYEAESEPVRVVPEATAAGDWFILAAIAVAVAGLLGWRRWSRRS
ncbi:hypothetical protein [Micromonospora globbae]|uniref:LPXTG cell wall anchor domain-containing protein n=1 Tax=Micromonospora globbae TaxID=1894969 RepID=A0ABZ1RZB1_9ACTN|nr:hypothetical protein [Micromonospora globbae]